LFCPIFLERPSLNRKRGLASGVLRASVVESYQMRCFTRWVWSLTVPTCPYPAPALCRWFVLSTTLAAAQDVLPRREPKFNGVIETTCIDSTPDKNFHHRGAPLDPPNALLNLTQSEQTFFGIQT